MSVYDFLDLCVDSSFLTVDIYDINSGKVAYSGNVDNIPDDYLYADVWSWDVPTVVDKITINICND